MGTLPWGTLTRDRAIWETHLKPRRAWEPPALQRQLQTREGLHPSGLQNELGFLSGGSARLPLEP